MLPRRQGHLGPVGERGRCGIEHALQHDARLIFAVEVVRHLLTVGAAHAADYLPSGLGTEQVDVSPTCAVAAVEPVLDPFRHFPTLERMCDYSGFCG